jgi:tetratricopeptide (TPR) repeat protein
MNTILAILSLSLGLCAHAQDLGPALDQAFQNQQWNEVIQLSSEVLRQNPNSSKARIHGAFALIQRGYTNAALNLLKKMSAADWKSIPKEMNQLVEIVALFQKKVPIIGFPARMDQLNESEASNFLQDEIRFAKGRSRFEKAELDSAKEVLTKINRGSRFYGPATYLLGACAVRQGKLPEAQRYFSQTFDPQVLQQSTEFWQDLGTQTTTQWGTSLNVFFDNDILRKSNEVGELSLLAMARILYAQKDFKSALAQYGKIQKGSKLFSRARLETVWALINLDRNEEAQAAAADLSTDEMSFEAIEARTARALVLTESGKSTLAREEIAKFQSTYEKAKGAMTQYRQFQNAEFLPSFLKGDLKEDKRFEDIAQYQTALRNEIAALRKEDRLIFPSFSAMAGDLEPLLSQSSEYATRLTLDAVEQRLKDLERLSIQSRLIVAETYLEEREKLRESFRGKSVDEATQDAHDKQLVNLLLTAIKEVDFARENMKTRNLSLEFRQSELLWELSSASAFLSKDDTGTTGKDAYEAYRNRSIAIARELADNHPKFDKRPQAMFFLGFTMMEVGNDKEGLSYLSRYVKEYPNHENVPNAYRILADVEFDASRFKQAAELYKPILKFPTSPIIGYALYKLGWCNYGEKNHAKALMGLEQAILWTRSMENTDHLLNLKKEAGRDLVSIYAEVGNHKRAYEYFERFLGGEESASWLAELAREHERSGLFEKSTDLYAQLLTMNPKPDDRLQYQMAIVYGAYQLRDWAQVLQRAKELAIGFETILSPEQGDGTPAFKAEKILSEVVLAQHFEFDQYAAKEDVTRILAIDEVYLQLFSKWKSSQMPQYQYAHFLMKHKKAREAAFAFTRHWETFKTTLKEPIKEESLRNLVHALETLDQEKDSAPEEVTKRVDQIVQFTGEYSDLYPTNKSARPISFLRAVALLKSERNEEGLSDSQKVFDTNPNDDFGGRAFKNLRVVYYKLKDWKRTFEWASAMLQKPGIDKTAYVADLKTVREEALFLWADGTEDNLKAAELYTRIAEDPQMLRLRPKALYNTFLRYKEAGKRPEALSTAIRLEQAAPTAPEIAGMSGVRAAFYQEAGDYEKALPQYEAFLKSPPKEASPEALDQARLSAALMLENLGRAPAAAALYSQIVAGASGLSKDAKRGLDRISENTARGLASVKAQPSKKWEALTTLFQEMEKEPLAKADGLAQKIQGGAQRLEKAIRSFLEVSGDPTTPPFYAFEAYCAVPFLYTFYQNGIRSLGEGQPEELKVELEKLAVPLDSKSIEIATACLSKSTESLHDGPLYRKVLARWGWQSNAALTAQMEKIRGILGGGAPWVEAADGNLNEESLIRLHLDGKGTPETWFALARLRMNENKIGLARLTFFEGLSKTPNSPRILNSLAVMKQMEKTDLQTLDVLYRKAGDAGSGLAYLNLALIHLNGARMELAKAALDSAEKIGTFADKAELGTAYNELKVILAPPPAPVTAEGNPPAAPVTAEVNPPPAQNREPASNDAPQPGTNP